MENNTERPEVRKRPIDRIYDIITVQLVGAAVFVIVALTVKLIGGSLYTETRGLYFKHFGNDTHTSVVTGSGDSENNGVGSDADGTGSENKSGPSDGEESGLTEIKNNSSGDGSGDGKESPSDASSFAAAPSDSSTSSGSSGEKTNGENKGMSASGSDTPVSTGAPAGTSESKDGSERSNKTKSVGNTLIWPIVGRITSVFGERSAPTAGASSVHEGIDISGNWGTPIGAAADGNVYYTGKSEGYGKYVILLHSNNFKTLYAHCSELKVKVGQNVKQGDTVALVGNTGRATGSHLHFETIIGGRAVDPTWLLSEMEKV